MKIGIIHYNMAWEDRPSSQVKISSLLNSSENARDVDWLIFLEMTLSGFSMDRGKTTLEDDDRAFFQKLAKNAGSHVTYGGVRDGCNRAVTLDTAGQVIHEYAKIHLFSFAGEDKYYRSGEVQSAFSIGNARITPLICYDLRFPYLFWDRAPETDIYVVLASWPASRRMHWRTLLQARAIENQAYVIGVNRVGEDPRNTYCGDSLVIDPLGSVILDCGDQEGLFETDIDATVVEETRRNFPFQTDRRRSILERR